MTTAKKYLDILKEREPQLWKEPLKESGFTDRDLAEIEKGLGYSLPVPYREFYQAIKYRMMLQPYLFLSAVIPMRARGRKLFPVRKTAMFPCRMMPLAQPLNLNGITSRETMVQTF